MKKIIAIVLTVLLLASVTASAADVKFTDVAETDKGYEAIYKLVNAGVLVGDGDGKFRPNDGLTRAEFCKIINLIFDYKEEAETNFKDVKETDWYYKEVLIAKKAGYIAGYGDDTFRGENMLTREETCVIISRVANLYPLPYTKVIKDNVSSWAKEYVEKVLANRLMSLETGDMFRATENITRAEMAMVSAGFVVEKEPEETTKPSTGGSAGGSSSGGSRPSGGGSSGGSRPSGGGSSGGSSTNYAEINEKMVTSLNSVINSFAAIEFTENEQAIIDIINACANDALGKATSIELTNEYIRETYKDNIDSAQALMDAMPEDEQNDFSAKVIRKVEDDAYNFLMDFFFPESE